MVTTKNRKGGEWVDEGTEDRAGQKEGAASVVLIGSIPMARREWGEAVSIIHVFVIN